MPQPRGLNGLPHPKTFASRPTGPREFAQRFNPELVGGPGTPPDGFLRATVSGEEWIIYWALYKVLEPNLDPRQPPFMGSKDPSKWVYQYGIDGARRELGGSVVDYEVFPYSDYNSVLIRLQTERFHVYVDPPKHVYDVLQGQRLSKYGAVYDIFSQQILGDKTGQAGILAVKDALRGVEAPNPLLTGQAVRVRV